MSDPNRYTNLHLPCLRGQVEDWIYYVTLMTYKEISKRFKPAEEIHENKTLNELLQRALTRRSAEIGSYILNQKQHFFNAIIAGIYEGEPKWVEIDINSDSLKNDSLVNDSIGVLELAGSEMIFAIDGQHRVEGIKNAISLSTKHQSEEGVVIFVAHNSSKQGLERTRRLFSTLNRYAKPVKLGEIIALDEDDAIAIITRRLLYHHKLLMQEGAIAPAKTKNLPQSNREALTSIQALYDFIERVLLKGSSMSSNKIKEFKRFRRSNETLDTLYENISSIFTDMCEQFDELKKFFSTKGKNRAERFRGGADGGFLLFRPVGMSILGEVLSYCIQRNKPINSALIALSTVPRRLSSKPWCDLIYDSENSKMMPRISKTDIEACSYLWLHLAGLLEVGDKHIVFEKFSASTARSLVDAKKIISTYEASK